VYSQPPRLLLTAPRLHRLRRELERQSLRWEQFSALMQGHARSPEPGFSLALYGIVATDAPACRAAADWALKTADPATRDAVMKLKPGQYTPVIPVVNPANHQPYAYMIVKLIAKEPAGQRDLNDPRVQQAIRQQLRDRREQLLKAAYYESLRDDAKIANYYADEILKNAGAAK